MKTNKPLAIMFATALSVAAPLANANYMSDPFQGLTFTFDQQSSTQLSFNITGTPSGDWADAHFLKAFDLKDLGVDFSDPSVTASASWDSMYVGGVNAQLNASAGGLNCGTTGGEKGSICFSFGDGLALGSTPINLAFDITLMNGMFDISSEGPHLQIAFLKNSGDTKKVGSLYSQNVPSVPEPGTLTLMGIGLLGLGFSQRKRVSNR
jgi:hypothetical protein